MSRIFYVSDGKLCMADGTDHRTLRSLTIENYLKTAKEIEERREWKSSGAGATFMGVAIETGPAEVHTSVDAVSAVHGEKLIYAAATETSCGLYTKNPREDQEPEGYITRRLNSRIYDIDYDPNEKLIVASVRDSSNEKHLALCHEDQAGFRLITEGESVDITPSFSRANHHIVYFSSAGYYRDSAKGRTVYDSYNLCRFDLRSNEITDVLASKDYDYLSPRETADGRLYCLRRPKEELDGNGASFTDIILVPFRMLKALFGWMNFFSQKYSGESLIKRSRGNNPAKQRDKSDEEQFIEGNLVNVSKALRENQLRGEKYPGIVPKSWELVEVKDGGNLTVVKKGVIDYAFDGDRLLYSNGKYLVARNPGGDEEKICEAKIATSLCVLS